MKFIGQGWEYKVYDLGNGRVLKREQTYLSQLYYIGWVCKLYFKAFKQIRSTRSAGKSAYDQFKTIKDKVDLTKFGNPDFTNQQGINYTQDKVFVFEDYFPKHSLEENKKLIDSYIDLLLYMWQFGFSDVVFNLTRNNGVRENGQVIQIDFGGELSYDYEKILNYVKTKRWLEKYSYTHVLKGEIKDYFAQQMELRLTEAQLTKLWCSAIS
ncbi:MAG: hypothetical protein V4519_04600 [Patescibacteria group bacterium]